MMKNNEERVIFLSPQERKNVTHLRPTSKDGDRNAAVFSLKLNVPPTTIKCSIFSDQK